MADQFKLEADELAKVSAGLRDIESRLKMRMSTLRGQLGAAGTPRGNSPAALPALRPIWKMRRAQ